MAKLEGVGKNDQGVPTGKVGSVNVTFGKIPEAPAWRMGPQQEYHSQKWWWVIREDEPRSVYVFKDELQQGVELDWRKCVAKHGVEDLAL